jgi:hypothetical protein
MKPSPADILVAIAKAEAGDWFDPLDKPINYFCELYAPDGRCAGNGSAHTAAQAMGMAWLHVWAPDALIDAYVEPGSVPFDIPPGWRFELRAPWESKPD